jgi:hypothetical protein
MFGSVDVDRNDIFRSDHDTHETKRRQNICTSINQPTKNLSWYIDLVSVVEPQERGLTVYVVVDVVVIAVALLTCAGMGATRTEIIQVWVVGCTAG